MEDEQRRTRDEGRMSDRRRTEDGRTGGRATRAKRTGDEGGWRHSRYKVLIGRSHIAVLKPRFPRAPATTRLRLPDLLEHRRL